jgi:hypothetical protein
LVSCLKDTKADPLIETGMEAARRRSVG